MRKKVWYLSDSSLDTLLERLNPLYERMGRRLINIFKDGANFIAVFEEDDSP